MGLLLSPLPIHCQQGGKGVAGPRGHGKESHRKNGPWGTEPAGWNYVFTSMFPTQPEKNMNETPRIPAKVAIHASGRELEINTLPISSFPHSLFHALMQKHVHETQFCLRNQWLQVEPAWNEVREKLREKMGNGETGDGWRLTEHIRGCYL